MSVTDSPEELRFSCLRALESRHQELLRQLDRSKNPEFHGKLDRPTVNEFLRKCEATGVALEDFDERRQAQRIHDYWSNRLFRDDKNLEVPSGELAPFCLDAMPELKAEWSCPYVGTRSFTEAEGQGLGRDRELDDIIQKVTSHLEDPASRVVLLVGPSGVGKASLVQAAVLPALRERESRLFIAAPLRLGSNPGQQVADACVAGKGTPTLLTIVGVASAFASFESALEGFLQDPGNKLLLCVDKVLERHKGWKELREKWAGLGLAVVEVPKPSVAVLQQAITRPTELALTPLEGKQGAQPQPLVVKNDALELLLQGLYGLPAALPLLQFVMTQLWAKLPRDRINVELLKSNDSPGHHFDPAAWLNRWADQQWAEAQRKGAKEDGMCRVLLELVWHDDELGSHRKPDLRTRVEGRVEDGAAIVNALIEVGLLCEHEPGIIEIAHEGLLRHWHLLRSWTEGLPGVVSRAAKRWNDAGRPTKLLLSEAELNGVENIDLKDDVAIEYRRESRKWVTKRLRRVLAGVSGFALVIVCLAIVLAVVIGWSAADKANDTIAMANKEARENIARAKQDAKADVEKIKRNFANQRKELKEEFDAAQSRLSSMQGEISDVVKETLSRESSTAEQKLVVHCAKQNMEVQKAAAESLFEGHGEKCAIAESQHDGVVLPSPYSEMWYCEDEEADASMLIGTLNLKFPLRGRSRASNCNQFDLHLAPHALTVWIQVATDQPADARDPMKSVKGTIAGNTDGWGLGKDIIVLDRTRSQRQLVTMVGPYASVDQATDAAASVPGEFKYGYFVRDLDIFCPLRVAQRGFEVGGRNIPVYECSWPQEQSD